MIKSLRKKEPVSAYSPDRGFGRETKDKVFLAEAVSLLKKSDEYLSKGGHRKYEDFLQMV